jgi:hypothetical protein
VLDRDPRLKRIPFAEQYAFGDYLSMRAVFNAKIADRNVDAALGVRDTEAGE